MPPREKRLTHHQSFGSLLKAKSLLFLDPLCSSKESKLAMRCVSHAHLALDSAGLDNTRHDGNSGGFGGKVAWKDVGCVMCAIYFLKMIKQIQRNQYVELCSNPEPISLF